MILTGTSILLASGKTKLVEKLRVGDVLRSHMGVETKLRELVPLRSKKNILLVAGKHFIVLHHDQPLLTAYGWMRARMLRAGDDLITYQQSGGGCAPLLWTNSQRDWDGRLAKVDFRTLNVPPWPSPAIGKIGRRLTVARAHVRAILPESFRMWGPLVDRWDRLTAKETREAHTWRAERDAALRAGEPFSRPSPTRTTIEAFLAAEKLSYSPAYFSNWATKVRKFQEESGSSQPGFDLLCDGGFVVPVQGDAVPAHIICRDAAKYDRPARTAQEEDDLADEDDSDIDPPEALSKARRAPSAPKMPPPSRTAKPPLTLSIR